MNSASASPPKPILVACLCADWCDVCRAYRHRFKQLKSKYWQASFLWIDVEDEADVLDLPDVENFPTLLLAVGDEPRFFGPVTPQAETLERLIRMQIEDAAAPALADPEVVALVARIRAEKLR